MKWLSRTLVTSPYCYGLCRSEKDFHRELKRLNVPRKEWPDFIGGNWDGASNSSDATTHFFHNKTRGVMAIVCVGSARGRTRAQVHALLTHEAVHVWQAIRDNIGEAKPSSEFEAYSIQAITQNLIVAYGEKP